MKYIYKYILTAAVVGSLFSACEKPNYVEPNDEVSINDFYATIAGSGRDRLFNSRISNDTVYVNIDYYYPIDSDNEVDLSQMLLRASLPVDSKVSPSLDGFTDLSKPFHIRVTAGDGAAQEYVVVANKKGNTKVTSALLTYEDVMGSTVESSAIIIGNDINFSMVPGEVMKNPRLTYVLNKHASGSITNGSSINLNSPLPFTVSAVGEAKENYTLKTIQAQRLPKGIRPGSAKLLFAKKMKAELGITADNLTSGLAVSGKYLVLNTRGENSMYLDAQTGQKLGQIELGAIKGSTRNMYSTSDDGGNLFINNLTPNDGAVLNIWKLSSITAAPELFISWNTGGNAYGRKVSIVGNVNQDAIITAPLYGLASSNSFARWQVKAGKLLSQTPEIVSISGYNWSWNNADVIYTSATDLNSDYYLTGYSANKLGKINGSTNTLLQQNDQLEPNFIANTVDYLAFNNAKFVAYNHINGQPWGSADQVYLLDAESPLTGDPSKETAAGMLWAAPKGLYGPAAASAPTNGNGTGDVIMSVSENGYYLYLYFMFTNGYVVGVQFDCIDI